MKNFTEQLRDIAFRSGAVLFGTADIKPLKKEFHFSDEILKDLDYAISIAVRLSGVILEGIIDAPTKLYYHHYRSINMALDQIALRLTNFLQSKGYKALPIPASQIVDWQKQTAHLSHKKIACLSGIGFLGRNNLVVSPEYGAHIRLVTILTDAPLKTDKPLTLDCGACKRCISVCPAGAIKEKQEDFDHIKCYEKLKEFRDKGIVGQFICGICVKACNSRVS